MDRMDRLDNCLVIKASAPSKYLGVVSHMVSRGEFPSLKQLVYKYVLMAYYFQNGLKQDSIIQTTGSNKLLKPNNNNNILWKLAGITYIV